MKTPSRIIRFSRVVSGVVLALTVGALLGAGCGEPLVETPSGVDMAVTPAPADMAKAKAD